MVDSAQERAISGVRVPRSVAIAMGLVIQIVVAVVLFVAIGAAAVLLNLATNACEAAHLAPTWAIFGMRGLEMLLWAIDVTCCVLLIVREALDFCVRAWNRRES